MELFITIVFWVVLGLLIYLVVGILLAVVFVVLREKQERDAIWKNSKE